MLMIGLAGLELDSQEARRISEHCVAGVLLFARNFASRAQLVRLCEQIRACRKETLLIAVDQEGGPVQRFRDGFTPLPALATIGELYDRDPQEAVRLAEDHAWVMASELRASDVDFSFAPVVDLARGNAAIVTRAFHADPLATSELAQAYIRGMHLAGMAAVLKHFPGHGSTPADTHRAEAVDPRTFDDIRRTDLLPFADCIAAHVEAVMVAHVIYPQVDASPAGYSAIWIKRVLRMELGFAGAVVSDDISMSAAATAGSIAERVRAHLQAGCDLVLACSPAVVEEAIAAMPVMPTGQTGVLSPALTALRGELGATWTELADNPQRERLVARVTAFNAGTAKGAA